MFAHEIIAYVAFQAKRSMWEYCVLSNSGSALVMNLENILPVPL
jgi:hypothetical protein